MISHLVKKEKFQNALNCCIFLNFLGVKSCEAFKNANPFAFYTPWAYIQKKIQYVYTPTGPWAYIRKPPVRLLCKNQNSEEICLDTGFVCMCQKLAKRALLSIKVVEQKDVTCWCEKKNPETDLWEILNISEIN